jgi:hypothetical protein
MIRSVNKENSLDQLNLTAILSKANKTFTNHTTSRIPAGFENSNQQCDQTVFIGKQNAGRENHLTSYIVNQSTSELVTG